MRENKEEILKAFTRVLQMTKCWENLDALLYDKGSQEVVVIVNGSEAKRINVANESGYAMIQDVVKNLPA